MWNLNENGHNSTVWRVRLTSNVSFSKKCENALLLIGLGLHKWNAMQNK